MADKTQKNKSGREVRTLPSGFTALSEERESGRLLITGTPIVFDTPTMLFKEDGIEFFEVIERGALDTADTNDFIFNVEHSGRVYARSRNRTLRLNITDTGAAMEAELAHQDEGHRQLYNDIKTGLLDRMSFSFICDQDGFIFDDGTKTFRVKQIKKLYDVSAVAFPAYDSTSISARCADLLGENRRKQAEECRRQQARARALATTYFT